MKAFCEENKKKKLLNKQTHNQKKKYCTNGWWNKSILSNCEANFGIVC